MFWAIAIILMLTFIPVFMFLQFRWLARMNYFQRTLSALREIKHEAVLCLFDNAFTNSMSPEDRKTIRDLIRKTDAMLDSLGSPDASQSFTKKAYLRLITGQSNLLYNALQSWRSKCAPHLPPSSRSYR